MCRRQQVVEGSIEVRMLELQARKQVLTDGVLNLTARRPSNSAWTT